MRHAITMVEAQAEDDGLFFKPLYASEAYLQDALRHLHAAVEKDAAEQTDLLVDVLAVLDLRGAASDCVELARRIREMGQ